MVIDATIAIPASADKKLIPPTNIAIILQFSLVRVGSLQSVSIDASPSAAVSGQPVVIEKTPVGQAHVPPLVAVPEVQTPSVLAHNCWLPTEPELFGLGAQD